MDKEKKVLIVGHVNHGIALQTSKLLASKGMKPEILSLDQAEKKRSPFDPEPILIHNFHKEQTTPRCSTNDVKSHYENRSGRRKKKFKR